MKIALVAQNATPLRPRTGSGPDNDDIGLSELTRKLAGHGHQVTVYAQKNDPSQPDHAELHAGVRVEHINAGPIPATAAAGQDDASLLERVPAFSGPLRRMWHRDRPGAAPAPRPRSGRPPGGRGSWPTARPRPGSGSSLPSAAVPPLWSLPTRARSPTSPGWACTGPRSGW